MTDSKAVVESDPIAKYNSWCEQWKTKYGKQWLQTAEYRFLQWDKMKQPKELTEFELDLWSTGYQLHRIRCKEQQRLALDNWTLLSRDGQLEQKYGGPWRYEDPLPTVLASRQSPEAVALVAYAYSDHPWPPPGDCTVKLYRMAAVLWQEDYLTRFHVLDPGHVRACGFGVIDEMARYVNYFNKKGTPQDQKEAPSKVSDTTDEIDREALVGARLMVEAVPNVPDKRHSKFYVVG